MRLGPRVDLSATAALLLKQLPEIKALAAASGDDVAASTPVPPPAPKISLSIAVEHVTVHDDPLVDEAHTLTYAYSTAADGSVVIKPQMEYLKVHEGGDPIDPTRYNWVPFGWDFPRLPHGRHTTQEQPENSQERGDDWPRPKDLLRLGLPLLDDAGGGSTPSRDDLGSVSHHNDRCRRGPTAPAVPDLTVKLRTELEIAKGEPRVPQARPDYARQLRRIDIERRSQDALEQR